MKTHLVLFTLLFSSYIAQSQTISENVSFNHGSCNFNAVLTKPSRNGPFKAIVIIPGSGQNDKDGTLTLTGANVRCLYPNLEDSTITPYKDLALNLTDSGYAVLRYDELTISCPNFSGNFSYDQLWLPVSSALDYLKTRTDVDTSAFIMIGHSEGSTIMPYIASKRNDIEAMISIGGARTPFDSILSKQLVDFSKLCNGDTSNAKMQAQQIQAYFDLVRSSNYTASTPAFGGVKPEVWEKYLNVNDSLGTLYQNSAAPALFIGMGKDVNVPLTELNRFRNELSGNFSFYALPDLLHYMIPETNTQVSRALTDTIVYWLRTASNTFSVGELQMTNAPLVYPNPFTDGIFLNFESKINYNIALTLLDQMGQVIWKSTFSPEDNETPLVLPYSKLAKGIYVLKGTSAEGNFHIMVQKK